MTVTPSSTTTPGLCPTIAASLTGNSGYFTGTLSTSGYDYSGYCWSGGNLPPTAKTFVTIDLSPSAVLGGSLLLTTCNPATGSKDTVLGVGSGACPGTMSAFNPQYCNDGAPWDVDVPGPPCASNGLASTILISSIERRSFTVAVSLIDTNAGGSFGAYTNRRRLVYPHNFTSSFLLIMCMISSLRSGSTHTILFRD